VQLGVLVAFKLNAFVPLYARCLTGERGVPQQANALLDAHTVAGAVLSALLRFVPCCGRGRGASRQTLALRGSTDGM